MVSLGGDLVLTSIIHHTSDVPVHGLQTRRARGQMENDSRRVRRAGGRGRKWPRKHARIYGRSIKSYTDYAAAAAKGEQRDQ